MLESEDEDKLVTSYQSVRRNIPWNSNLHLMCRKLICIYWQRVNFLW